MQKRFETDKFQNFGLSNIGSFVFTQANFVTSDSETHSDMCNGLETPVSSTYGTGAFAYQGHSNVEGTIFQGQTNALAPKKCVVYGGPEVSKGFQNMRLSKHENTIEMTSLKGHCFVTLPPELASKKPSELFDEVKNHQNRLSDRSNLRWNKEKKTILVGDSASKKCSIEFVQNDGLKAQLKVTVSLSASASKNVYKAACHNENLSLSVIVYSIINRVLEPYDGFPFEEIRQLFGDLPISKVKLTKKDRQPKIDTKVQYCKNGLSSALKTLPTCSKQQLQAFENVFKGFSQELFELSKTNENAMGCVKAIQSGLVENAPALASKKHQETSIK